MQITPINNSTNFQAVNQKYYQWAQKEAKGVKSYAELFYQLKFDVSLGKLLPQDAIDTINAIEKIYPENRKDELNLVLKYVKNWLP